MPSIKMLPKSGANDQVVEKAIRDIRAALPPGTLVRAVRERNPQTHKVTGVIANLPASLSPSDFAAAQAAIDGNPSFVRSGLTEDPAVGVDDFEDSFSGNVDGDVVTSFANGSIAATVAPIGGGIVASRWEVEANNPLAGTRSARHSQIAAEPGFLKFSQYTYGSIGRMVYFPSSQGFVKATAITMALKYQVPTTPSGADSYQHRLNFQGKSFVTGYNFWAGVKSVEYFKNVGEWVVSLDDELQQFSTGITDLNALLDLSIVSNQFEDSITVNGTKYTNSVTPTVVPDFQDLIVDISHQMRYLADASRSVPDAIVDDVNFDVVDGTF